MNYEQFYKEVAAWIQTCNGEAVKLGMDSNEFWSWVTRSIGEISEKYGNNELVKRQMIMLFEWLKDIYERSKSS